MGQTYAEAGGIVDFTVTPSNPSGTTVRFTVADPCVHLTTSKLIRMVIGKAMDDWIAAERADLDANGDSDVKGSDDWPGVGDGFKNVNWNFAGKYADLPLTALTNLDTSTPLTVEIPFADTI